jgi:cytochrome c biogenesis protein CcdA
LLLLIYALGHSVLILIAGTPMGAARTLLENKKTTRTLELLRSAAGTVIVLVGIYFAYQGLK